MSTYTVVPHALYEYPNKYSLNHSRTLFRHADYTYHNLPMPESIKICVSVQSLRIYN